MKLSLTKKTIILIVCIAIVVGTFAIAIYNKGSYDLIVAQYEHYSIDVTKLVAGEIDAERLLNVQKAILDIYEHSENKVMSDQWGTPEFEAYVSQFAAIAETDDYKAIHADLQKMQDKLDVDCLYITWVDQANECYVYLIDAAHEEPCPPGCIDPLYFENNAEALKELTTKGMRPNISKTEEYGWLLATGSPIYDGNGELIAIVNVDISMNIAMAELMRFMNFIICAFAAVTVLICVLAILLMRKLIIKPISILSHAATQYKSNSTAFSELNMKRKDEIGILADSMAKMEKDINGYISELTSAREHADKMDRVANTDALTKALSKRAYDRKVRQLNEYKTPYGIALVDINDLKGINDTYGHEKGDISIQTVCRFISRVFGRSAVYRIGGDEFVVVLENENYKKRDALIREFLYSFRANEANTSLQPWERASAAIGYAIYDPETDENAESVFQRADAAMYENKKALKKAK